MLSAIERATRQRIEPLELPSTETVNNKRIADFKQKISDTLGGGDLAFMRGILEQYQQEHDVPALDIAAALAKISLGERPLLMKPEKRPSGSPPATTGKPRDTGKRVDRIDRGDRGEPRRQRAGSAQRADMDQFRIEVGREHGVLPSNIVGAIANEAGLDAQHIGHIDIQPEFSTVELPIGMPKEVFRDLRKVWVCGRQLKISRLEDMPGKSAFKTRTKGAGNAGKRKSASRPDLSRPDLSSGGDGAWFRSGARCAQMRPRR